jgi:hypothetical protein
MNSANKAEKLKDQNFDFEPNANLPEVTKMAVKTGRLEISWKADLRSEFCVPDWNLLSIPTFVLCQQEADMGFGRGALLWLIGIPLPIILLIAIFMHH